ncbi:hypothetical protein [Kribbella sp. NPDC048928]|uniref:hypothetical protein n=1 Tax=Kribbella sp. NPDC048928 TaxID=3364111 RepID=UPI00371179C0
MSTLGAALIGGIIAPYVTKSRERREARAEVLNAILELEQRRWGEIGYDQFQRAAFALQATAVIARVPRWAVVAYLDVAKAARDTSREFDSDDGPTWVIDSSEEAKVQRELNRLTRVIWHPVLGRLYGRRRGRG